MKLTRGLTYPGVISFRSVRRHFCAASQGPRSVLLCCFVLTSCHMDAVCLRLLLTGLGLWLGQERIDIIRAFGTD